MKSLVAGLFCVLISAPAFAITQYLQDPTFGFVQHYDKYGAAQGKGMLGTNESTCYSCNICHSGLVASLSDINSYAIAWRSAWMTLEPSRTTGEAPDANADTAFANVAENNTGLDSDGDRVTNINEILAGSGPGDPNATPTTKNCTQTVGTYGGGGPAGPPANYNPNALNAKCGFDPQSAYGGFVQNSDSASSSFETIILFLMPLMLGVLLRFKRIRFPIH